MNAPIIEITNLTKVYGAGESTVNALDGVDMSVQKGEFVAIMGPSGSGKSTLMNIIGCLDRPSAGEYYLDGRDVSKLDRNDLAEVRNAKLGFIFQSFNLLPRLTALENVMMPMFYVLKDELSVENQRRRAAESLDSVGLANRVHHKPNQLSGGQQQRVAIARALINHPPVILADEPTGNLDSRSSVEILDLLHKLHQDGVTIVMVTHEPDVAQHAQRIICVRDGKVISDGREGISPCLDRQAQTVEKVQ